MKKVIKKSAGNTAMKKGTKLKKFQYAGEQLLKKPSIAATDEEKKNYEIPGRREAVNKMGQMERDRQEGKTYPYKISDLQPRLPKEKKGGSTKAKKFAALAPPYNKATAADRIAGAKKSKSSKKK